MKNNVTELVFIIDKSGSMSGLENDTIGGFNSMLNKQKQNKDKCYVTTVLFDSQLKTIHDRLDISEVGNLTHDDYQPYGSTALIDAIGETVKHISNIHKYSRKEDVPENTLFMITTDGMENSSVIHSSDEVKKMIEKAKNEKGWEFIFIGANIDSVETAKHFGIKEDKAVNYVHDAKGTGIMYNTLCDEVSNDRRKGKLSADWSRQVKKDTEERGNL